MSNYLTSSDILDSALFDCGESLNGTSDYEAEALTALNRAYQMIWMGGAEIDPTLREEWVWLRSATPGVIILNYAFTAGTVSVTHNTSVVTFSSPPALSTTGWFFKADSSTDVFLVTGHAQGGASAQLDSVYTGVTNPTDGYKLFQIDYSLPTDILRIISPMRIYRDNRSFVTHIDQPEFEQRWPLTSILSGAPENYCMVGSTTVRFSHYGSETIDDRMRVDFDYLKRPSDLIDSPSSIPLVPQEWRRLLADYICTRILVNKNDNRADGYALQFLAGVRAMARENRHRLQITGSEAGHIYPRAGDILDRILRTDTGAIIG